MVNEPVQNLVADDLNAFQESIWSMFGVLSDEVSKLFIIAPGKGVLRPHSATEIANLEADLAKHDLPYLKNAIDHLPETFGQEQFAKVDFLCRVKRARGSLFRDPQKGSLYDVHWAKACAIDLATRYKSATDADCEKLVGAFADRLTGSKSQYQSTWRRSAATKRQRQTEDLKSSVERQERAVVEVKAERDRALTDQKAQYEGRLAEQKDYYEKNIGELRVHFEKLAAEQKRDGEQREAQLKQQLEAMSAKYFLEVEKRADKFEQMFRHCGAAQQRTLGR